MRAVFLTGLALGLSACVNATGGNQQAPRPGQGQYVYPEYRRPQPTPMIPPSDECGARLYQGLTGTHIGAVHIAAIGGDKRIISPATLEIEENDFLVDMQERPPFLEVREMLAGQPLYAASVRTGVYPGQIGPERMNRLTIELDNAGYILTAACG